MIVFCATNSPTSQRRSHTYILSSLPNVLHFSHYTVFQWQVVKLDRVLDAGFTHVIAVIEGLDEFSGHQVKLIAKNEFYIARIVGGTGRVVTDGPVLACTPDLICVIDSDKGT